MLKITIIKIWKVYFPRLTPHYNLKIAIMWIQKVAHSVLNLYKHCLFSCSRILNVNEMVASSRDMYLDAHVKPLLLTDVNKWFWVKSRRTTLFICPWFYKHQIRRSSRSAGEAATHNIKLTERGVKKKIKTDIYIVISEGAVYKGAIFNFSLPTSDVIRLRIWAE